MPCTSMQSNLETSFACPSTIHHSKLSSFGQKCPYENIRGQDIAKETYTWIDCFKDYANVTCTQCLCIRTYGYPWIMVSLNISPLFDNIAKANFARRIKINSIHGLVSLLKKSTCSLQMHSYMTCLSK